MEAVSLRCGWHTVSAHCLCTSGSVRWSFHEQFPWPNDKWTKPHPAQMAYPIPAVPAEPSLNVGDTRFPSQRPKRQQLHACGIPKIVDEPASHLSEEEKEQYEVFQTEYRRLAQNKGYTVPSDKVDFFSWMLTNYYTYAGIPEEVEYTLATFDGIKLHSRPTPAGISAYQAIIDQSNEEGIDQSSHGERNSPAISRADILQRSWDWIKYYQSTEWGRTSSWSSRERVTVLCKSAHSIGTKTIEMKKRTSEPPAAPNSPPTSAHPPSTGSQPVDRMYAILMFAIPFSRLDETHPDGEPCFENHGHFLHVYEGHEKCKWQSTGPTYIPTGVVQDEYALCGYKIEDKGGNRGRS